MRTILRDECPRCFYACDSISGANHDGAPSVGDVTICLNCAGVFLLNERLQMREMTEEEAEPIMADPLVIKSVALIKKRGPLKR